jgi:hypothetical protein
MTGELRPHGGRDAAAQPNRRRLVTGAGVLMGVALLVLLAPWAVWPIATLVAWLVAIGAVVFVVVRLASR